MATFRHIVRLPMNTGLPSDVAINVFHSVSDDGVGALGFRSELVTFYNAIDSLMASYLVATANQASITTYDLADPEPRAPIDTLAFTLTPGTGGLPPEVAICLSFQAARVSGLSQARRRGRVFLGPWGSGLLQSDGRPGSSAINTITTAADALLTAGNGVTVGNWAVYSPTNAAAVQVADGWVDNEFDTIRERGRIATTRTTFT